MTRFESFSRSLDRLTQWMVLGYQTLVLVAFVVIPILAYNWLHLPFLGAIVEQTMVINNQVTPSDPADWPLLEYTPDFGYQLVEVAGVPTPRTSDLQSVLRRFSPSDTVEVVLRSPTGELVTHSITLTSFPLDDQVLFLYVPYLVGLIYLAISLWIYRMRRSEPAGRAFALFASSVALATGALFDLYTTHVLSYFWTVSIPIAASSLIELTLVFPQEARLVRRYPSLRRIGYLIALGLIVYALPTVYDVERPLAYATAWKYIYIFGGISVLFFVAIMLLRWLSARSPVVRNQARNILLSIFFGFGPLATWFVVFAVFGLNQGKGLVYNPYLLFPLVIFPLMTGYTILRQRLLQTDFVIQQGTFYALLTILVLMGYAFLVAGLFIIFGPGIDFKNPLFIGASAFLLALALNPARNRLQQLVDKAFFRGVRAYEERVRTFSHELLNTVDQAAILRTLRRHISESLLPDQIHIYVYEPLNDLYIAAAGDDGKPTSDLRFTSNSPFPQLLSRNPIPFYLDEASVPAEIRSELPRLKILGANLFVPMVGSERLIGWLALGERRSGESYNSADLIFLDQISAAAAVAIERAQVIFNLERRVREMNILSRVAQGVNVTVNFDDILELIYAQTDQVLPVDYFYITLYNKTGNYYYHAFCLENDDRVPAKENVPLPPDTGLAQEVIRQRRSILTSDYTVECQQHSVSPDISEIYAWMSVPLNAGAETIGALSIGSRDALVAYTAAQMQLLKSIADQAAGAIVKARLLQETERRARQLTILNEITRQLTGTLESEPLLEKILESAINILNCEAGTLFLVDEQTDELVFRVVRGPVASTLVGQRLAPGTGLVGEVVRTRQPIIANNVQQTDKWFSSPDKTTGFVTRSILAIPLQIKDRVIGVLEVINRKDSLPFVEDDINLLAAFAGQAAVAIENSRLYTLTDQELNRRVEELSVMQRIDRELNTTLDVNRAMHITLEWAMRQTKADAGLIGVLEEHGIRLIAQQGYEEIEQQYQNRPIPVEQPALRAALETGQAQLLALDDFQPGLLPGARTQIVVPIRREAKAIGVLLLESRSVEGQRGQEMNFLTRLCDHAAIAISNAQLYAEIQRANEAKSEFVSFVAHELKNPMTSIKGYTELLAKGAVGPVTEMQLNFLNTIRSNVERMSTLVSDLNDSSKIEAGRLRLDFKSVEVGDVLDEVMRSSSRQVEDKKQTLEVRIPERLPRVWADRTRMIQVLINLVSNANKYTPEGGKIIIGAKESANHWDSTGASKVVHIWVQDNGIGISLEDQKKIFSKFFRSEDQKAREAPGTGLGLTITKSLVEMMGGRIWFESEFRQGTTFHFTVPVAEE